MTLAEREARFGGVIQPLIGVAVNDGSMRLHTRE